MPNISHFNVSDVAVYYQALVALTSAPTMAANVATEEIRRRAVTYLERRRAMFSLPPLRGQLETLGEKVLGDLRQMGLASIEANKVKLTAAGFAIVESLRQGEGRRARLALLGRLVETYDNAAYLCLTLAPPKGRRLYLPIPRSTSEAIDDDDGEPRLVPSNLESVCAAWAEWCEEQRRPDLLPPDLQKRTETLLEASQDKRGFAEKARNALAQLVLEVATQGRIGKAALFRTIRDRLSTAGGLNSVTRPVAGKPLSVEVVFTCMCVGVPPVLPEEWQPLGSKVLHLEDIWIHEAEPAVLESSVLTSMKAARGMLVERAGYYRIFELRDRVCEALGLSQGMFDSAFVHIYRTKQGLMTLGVDYEKITSKRLPIEIRDGGSSNLFNLVAFKGA